MAPVLPRGEGAAPRGWTDISALLLAVEVLSPSTARRDRWQKRHMYQAFGASEYWMVDTNARLVERWRPNDERPEVCSDTLPWAPAGARAPLIIDLVQLFAVVAGERD